MKKDSAIIYESVYKTIELIPDIELKWEAIKGILRYGFYGEELNSDNPLVEMVYTSAFPSLRNAVERYERAVENGKKGGRPTEVSTEKIIQMKNKGMTNKQIADETGCSIKNIEKRITAYNKSNPTNPTNPLLTQPEHEHDKHPTNPTNPPLTPLVCRDKTDPTNPTNLSVYVSEYVSEYEYDDVYDDVYVASPDNTASPNNATDVAQQQQSQQTTLSNLIKYKIREMWQPGVKQIDVIKSIKSEFNIDLTFADINEIWDKYKSFDEKEKLRELAEKEKSELTKQVKVSAKDKKHYNEAGRAKEIIKELNLNSVSEINITEKEIIDWYNDAYEKAKTQPKYKYDFTMDQMIKFISDEALTVDNIQELKNAWCQKINLERGWTWS